MPARSNYYIDPLTGLYNRAYFEEQIPLLLASAIHERRRFQLVIFDIDYFKRINDFFGHRVGDSVLREFASFLKQNIRQDDIILRYGGDEFLAILFDMDYQTALKVLERIVEKCKSREFAKLNLTISVGVAGFPEHAKNLEGLFELADKSLYNAKRNGRGRVGVIEKLKAIFLPSPEMVGRDQELNVLVDFLQSREKNFVLISGEIGIGKTRLLKELLKTPIFKNDLKFEITLSPLTSSILLYPFREFLREILHMNPQIAEKLSNFSRTELAKLYPSSSKSEEDTIYIVDKYRLFESFSEFIRLTSNRLFYFIIDNLQWADRYSVELLQYLLLNSEVNNISVIATVRTEDLITKPHLRGLRNLKSDIRYFELPLKHLEQSDVEELIINILNQKVDDELFMTTYSKSNGNPYFVGELVQHFVKRGKIYWSGNKWNFDKNKEVDLPDTIATAIEMKIAYLPSSAKEILEYLAVFGRPISLDFLEKLTQKPSSELIETLIYLTEYTFLERLNYNKYWFHEQVVSEIIYNRINPEKRKEIHLRIAKILSQKQPEYVEELAHHLFNGGDAEKAYIYSLRAAEEALRLRDLEKAVLYYTMAIKTLTEKDGESDSQQLIELWLKRGNTYKTLGETDKAVSDYSNALKIARHLNNNTLQFQSLYDLALALIKKNELNEAKSLLEEAKAIARTLKDEFMLARCYIAFGILSEYKSQIKRAATYYKIALNLTTKINNKDALILALNNLADVECQIGNFEESISLRLRALELCKEIKDTRKEISTILNLGSAYAALGNISKAEEFYLESIEKTQIIKDVYLKGVATHNLGILLLHAEGDIEKSEKYLEESLKIFHLIGDKSSEVSNLNSLAVIARHKGNFRKAHNYLQKARRLATEIKNYSTKYYVVLNMAITSLETGKYQKALKYANMAEKLLEKTKQIWHRADIEETKGAVLYHMGLFEEAKRHLSRAIELAEKTQNRFRITSALLSRASMFLDEFKLHDAQVDLDRVEDLRKEKIPLNFEFDLIFLKSELKSLMGSRAEIPKIKELLSKLKQQSMFPAYMKGLTTLALCEICQGEYQDSLKSLSLAKMYARYLNTPFYLAKSLVLETIVFSKTEMIKDAENAFSKASKILRRIKADPWIGRFNDYIEKLKKIPS